MSFYKQLMSTDQDAAFQLYYEKQKGYEKTKNAIMYFALFGGMLLLVIIGVSYGETASSLCGIVGSVWYVLGYHYCEAMWNKEKDAAEFHDALDKHEHAHPEQNT